MTLLGVSGRTRPATLALCVCAVILSLAFAGSARAATVSLTVNTTADTDQSDVGSCATGGSCTLREAVNQANLDTGDTITITLDAGTYTLDSTYGPLVFTTSATVTGPGASSTAITGSNATALMTIDSPASVGLGGVTLENGNNGSNDGGAVFVNPGASLDVSQAAFTSNTTTGDGGAIEDEGTLSVDDSSFTGNSAADGGAIKLDGYASPASVTVTDSTLSGNTASQTGGAIRVQSNEAAGTSLTVKADAVINNTSGLAGGGIEDSNLNMPAQTSITDSTIADNTTTGILGGGGLYVGNGPDADQIVNDTIVGNKATGTGPGGDVLVGGGAGKPMFENTIVVAGTASSGPDCSGTITSGGHNLDDANGCGFTAAPAGTDLVNAAPDLGPLQSNGGPTDTLALLAGSPAIDAGSGTGCPGTDQRGVARPQGTACDIGAYEWAPPVLGTAAASDVGTKTAVINAVVANPDVQDGLLTVQFGTSTAYATTAPSGTLSASTADSPYTLGLTGLTPGTVYHFRVVAADPDGTVYGPDEQFTTATTPTPTPTPPVNKFSFGKVKVAASGRLTISLGAPDAGSFSAKATFSVRKTVITHKRGKRIVKHVTTTYTYGTGSAKSSKSSTLSLSIGLGSSPARELKKLGSAKVTVTVTFSPTGGTSHKESTTITVKRSRKGKYS